MKLQYLTVIFVIIMLPIVLVLSQFVGIQVDTIATKTKLDTSLLGATYDTMVAYELNTRNTSTSSVVSEDIRELEAVISTFTRSLSSSMGLTGVANDYILSYIPAIAFCMYDGYYIYMPNEPTSGSEKLQPYVYYTRNYVSDDGKIDITIAYSLDNYVSIYGICNNEPVSAAGYLVIPEDVTIENLAYVSTIASDGGAEYKVLSGTVKYKGINIEKETLYENKTIKNSRTIIETSEETTDAMLYYYQAKKFTEIYNDIIRKFGEDSEIYKKLYIKNTNDPESETSTFNDEKVNVIKDALTSNLNRAIYNFEGVNKDIYEMPQLNGEDWDKILNNISIVAFMKDMPLNNATIYNNYVVVNSTITQKYTSAKSLNFIGYDSNFKSKGYYHKITCEDFLKNIKEGEISNIIGYSSVDFERYKGAEESEREYFYYYKHNEYADYSCEVKPEKSVDISTLKSYLDEKVSNGILSTENSNTIRKAYYTAIGRIRFRQSKASSYINLENNDTNNFTVTFNLNGGSWSIVQNTIQSKYQKLEIPRVTPTKTGKVFIGWKVAGSTTNELAKIGNTLYSTSNITLVAQYGEAYTITYYRDDGTIYKTQTKIEYIDLELLKDYPGKEGKEFIGWDINRDNYVDYNIIDINNIQRWVIKENSNLDLYPIYKEREYVVKYIDNMGVNNYAPEYIKDGEKITIKSGENITGAIFRGWGKTLGSAGDANYSPGSQIEIHEDLTLYAKWNTVEYTVIFNKNDGSEETEIRNIHIYDPFTKPYFTIEGYRFIGWSKTSNGEIDDIQSYYYINSEFIEKYFASNTTINVYAKWEIRTWDLIFADNSGDIVTGIPGFVSGEQNINTSKYEITIPSDIPESENYRFDHWEDSNGNIFMPGQTYTYDNIQIDLTVYAVWIRTKITITYYSNSNKTEYKQELVDVGTVRLATENEVGFHEFGNLLYEWIEVKSGEPYTPGYNIYNQYDDTEFYATWHSSSYDGDYQVYYISNTKDIVYNLPESQFVQPGESVIIQGFSEPIRTGYTFRGWTDIEGGTETNSAYNPGMTISNVRKSYKLYAVWDNTHYIVNYYKNTDDNVYGIPAQQTAQFGYGITISGTGEGEDIKPIRFGFAFKGWTDIEGGTEINSAYNPGRTITRSSNLNLYAVWGKIEYSVTYNKNAEDIVTGIPSTQTGGLGESITIQGDPAPTRTGFTFRGWTDDVNGTTVRFLPGRIIQLYSNTTLYALWRRNTYTISYNKNTTDSVGNMPDSQTAEYGISTTLSNATPSRSLYKFKGWTDEENGTVVKYNRGDSITIYDNKTLYAVWRQLVWHTCSTCGGTGKVTVPCPDTPQLSLDEWDDCDFCSVEGIHGTLHYREWTCNTCGVVGWGYYCTNCGESDSTNIHVNSKISVNCSICDGDGGWYE